MTHVVVMSLSGAVGITVLFVVDMLDLFFLSLLGEESLAAAVGYAGTITFMTSSVGIGFSIAAGALAAKAIGQKRRDQACRFMTNVSVVTLAVCIVLTALVLAFIPQLLDLLGAYGRVHELAARYLYTQVNSRCRI
ncbi:hypothetical protein GZ77_09365 [Endozoicomonas montiporae]|uniref:Uncharacterized protein n=1 Tax=Endozoicomonas montiporae TaxID=1027273 RepID=A0A081N7W2_9GAMM|nr:MATE family efflux transporter [Endozoicomonas montiporae]KEQ14535.1 hypothetical protein GZ77_09365 [Endozoicomonas montiporae]